MCNGSCWRDYSCRLGTFWLKIRTSGSACALDSPTWRAFQELNHRTRRRWMIAFRSWQRLIFQSWAEQRVTGTLLSLRCAAAPPVFVMPTILAEPWLPTFQPTSGWVLLMFLSPAARLN